MKGGETSNTRKAKWAWCAACLCLAGLILHLFATPFSAMLPSAADDASVHHGSQPPGNTRRRAAAPWQCFSRCGQLERRAHRACGTVAKACSLPVVPAAASAARGVGLRLRATRRGVEPSTAPSPRTAPGSSVAEHGTLRRAPPVK